MAFYLMQINDFALFYKLHKIKILEYYECTDSLVAAKCLIQLYYVGEITCFPSSFSLMQF